MPTYKIHPAIGFARVGNSSEYFIGPEKRYVPPNPPGGFKDRICRIKRQAARFRIFEYPDTPGADPIELDHLGRGVEVTWGVDCGSGERTVPARAGGRTLTTGGMYLGELRSDEQGRLLVLPGFGFVERGPSIGSGSDDTWDGPVVATLRIDGELKHVVPAWAVVGPPKYAPQIDTVVTLWDVFEDIRNGTAPLTGPVSYTEHIYPILKRRQSMRWVSSGVGAGVRGWDLADVSSLPRAEILASFGTGLTRLQSLRMQAFCLGPPPTETFMEPVATAGDPPAGELDRAALEACDGGPFAPGVEVSNAVYDATLFDPSDRARIKTGTPPRTLRYALEVPWAADILFACRGLWPATAPREVLQSPDPRDYAPWFDESFPTPTAVLEWTERGFVVEDPATGVQWLRPCNALYPRGFGRFVEIFATINRFITVGDPPPIDLARFTRLLFSRVANAGPSAAAAHAPADELTRLMTALDGMREPQLRVELLELRAKIARLEAAARMVEGKLKDRQR